MWCQDPAPKDDQTTTVSNLILKVNAMGSLVLSKEIVMLFCINCDLGIIPLKFHSHSVHPLSAQNNPSFTGLLLTNRVSLRWLTFDQSPPAAIIVIFEKGKAMVYFITEYHSLFVHIQCVFFGKLNAPIKLASMYSTRFLQYQ